MLDIFTGDAFSTVELTAAIEKLPYKPGKLGAMGLFKKGSTTKTTVVIEEKNGTLSLLKTEARGTMPNYQGRESRKARAFKVPHIPINDAVFADDVQDVRAFGEEDATEAVNDVVNDKLERMKQSMETTVEYHRVGALQGVVYDADGEVLFNWFDEFDITEQEISINVATDDLKRKAQEVIRMMEDTLGATNYDQIWAMCGNNFWDDMMTSNDLIRAAYDRWQNGQFYREQQDRDGFPFGGIMWFNYRGQVGTKKFVNDNGCRFFPTGVPDLFQETYAPADFVEAVNTKGKPWYAKQEPMRFGKGIEIHCQSNPLLLCTRPAVLIEGRRSDEGSSSGAPEGP